MPCHCFFPTMARPPFAAGLTRHLWVASSPIFEPRLETGEAVNDGRCRSVTVWRLGSIRVVMAQYTFQP